MIKLTAIGNLGRDCEVKEANGKHVINFSIAHTEKFKDQEKTTWIDCAYWSEKTGIAPYLKKGTTVYIEGTPDVRTYQTNDGRQGASLTCRVSSIQLIGGKDSQAQNNQSAQSAQSNASRQFESMKNAVTENADDLPF